MVIAWEGLFDLHAELDQVVESVGLPLDYLDLVVDAFQWAGANGAVAMVQDAILKASQRLDELAYPVVVPAGRRSMFASRRWLKTRETGRH